MGAFATPLLLSTGENRPISLFSYILLLNAGLAWVATKKKWPLLTALTLIFTALYQWGWIMKFLTADKLPVAYAIFLVFPILTFIAIALGHEERPDQGWISLYGQTANLSALLPLLFALYVAAVKAYGQSYALLFLGASAYAVFAEKGPIYFAIIAVLPTALAVSSWSLLHAQAAW
jgi:uncharacterized membrane protein